MPAKKTHEQFLTELQIYNERVSDERQLGLAPGQEYGGLDTPLEFVCSVHGSFVTKPRNVLVKGAGCPTCARAVTAAKNTKTDHNFLTQLGERNKTHPPIQYVSGFAGTSKKCTFRCDECAHTWDTEPKSILRGHGCPECANRENSSRQLLTQEQFLSRLMDRNSTSGENVYLADGEKYLGNDVKIKFRCDANHVWETRPNDVTIKQAGCPHCAGVVSRSAEEALQEIGTRWPGLTINSNHPTLLGRRERIEVQCEYGHTWNTHYERLMQGHYCPHCNQNAKYDIHTFGAKLKKVTKTIVPVGEYVNVTTPITATCTVCSHEWKPRPYNLLQGYGCPRCSKNNKFSKKALAWLSYIEMRDGIAIQHANQYGEFRIPGTKYRADGYCVETNTVYEFYGDYWHGNPKTTSVTQYNPHLNKTYGDLFQHTIRREDDIRARGFNLVSIWESEYDELVRTNFVASIMGVLKLQNCAIVEETPGYVVLETPQIVAVVLNTARPPDGDERLGTQRLLARYRNEAKYSVLLFADELADNPELIQRKFAHYCSVNTATKIGARELRIGTPSKAEKKALLDANHVQGNDNAQVNLGAYLDNKLVAVMTFSHPRVALGQKGKKDRTGIWELSRFCTDVNYRIPGVASRLLKHFQRNYSWKEIYSYADKRWSVGNMYTQLGFELVADNPPDYFYVVGGVRKHRWNYRKDVIKNTLPNYDPALTEYQNMQNHGFWRVWDCGTLKYAVANNS